MNVDGLQTPPQPGNTARRELLERFGRFAALTPTAMILLPAESQAGDRKGHDDKKHHGKHKQKRHRNKGSEYH